MASRNILGFVVLITISTASAREAVFVKASNTHRQDDDAFLFDCLRQCAFSDICMSTNVLSSQSKCIHLNVNQSNLATLDETVYKKIIPLTCQNGGNWKDETNSSCACSGSFAGTYCERYWNDCTEGFRLGIVTSGIYTIQPRPYITSFQVYCKMVWGGRTYIQNQMSGVDFYRNWQEYRDGFGSLDGDHWLGLEKIKAITDSSVCHLLIQVRYHDDWKQRYFLQFRITNESDGYRMTFTSTDGTYKIYRDLPDALTELIGARFSTYDRDNDDNPDGNCAQIHHSGWWFKNCTSCNPNGRLKPIPTTVTGDPAEITWPGKTQGVIGTFMALKQCIPILK